MLGVPSSLNELLLLFAPCFSRPTFETFRRWLWGRSRRPAPRTVCGMLVGARLSGGLASLPRASVLQSRRAGRSMSSGCGSPTSSSSGCWRPRRADGVGDRRHAAAPAGTQDPRRLLASRRDRQRRQGDVAWGNNWVVVGIVVGCRSWSGPSACRSVPLLAAQAHTDRQGQARSRAARKARLARGMVDMIAARYPEQDRCRRRCRLRPGRGAACPSASR